MNRECARCGRVFGPGDLDKQQSRHMEADRRALGLEGVRFLYYACPGCGHADIFLDLHHQPGETDEEFAERRRAMEDAVRQVQPEGVEVVFTER
jgi:hypothetical protein